MVDRSSSNSNQAESISADYESAERTHRFATVNGLRLHALDYGGGGPTAIFLHGVTGHAWTFDGVASRLRGRVRVIAIDLRGHGDTQWSPDGAYNSPDAAADIVEMIRENGQTVDVVGSSWGGLIALLVGHAIPQLVRRIVAIDIPPSTDRRPDDVRPKPTAFRNNEEIVDWERKQHPSASDDVVRALAFHGYRPVAGGLLGHKYDPVFLRHWAFRSEDHWELLGSIDQPTLVIRCGQSTALAAQEADEMVRRVRRGQLSTLDGAGHLPELDDPAAVSLEVGDFIVGPRE